MFEELIWLTGIVPAACMLLAYIRTRDTFHPLMFLGPMLIYIYAFRPGTYFYQDLLRTYFPDESRLAWAQLVQFASTTAFCIGCLWVRVPPQAGHLLNKPFNINPLAQKRLERASYVMAAVGLVAYFYSLSTLGGFIESYSRAKGGGAAGGMSGYVTSAPLLTILATILYLLSQRGRKMSMKMALVVALFVSPHLIQGLLGGSRGAFFLAIVTVFVGWYLARAQRPAFRTVLSGMIVLGTIMLLLHVYRRQIYIGSEFEFDAVPLQEVIVPSKLAISDPTTYSWALILTSDHNSIHYWGLRYATQLFVRPIPRQFWPTKYDDVGMGWMVTRPGSAGIMPSAWQRGAGWVPEAGSSSGFIPDLFLEFGWGGLVACFFLGYFYAWLWKKAVTAHGIWVMIYFEACVVSVYLPTQGLISAWFYRFLYLATTTLLVWQLMLRHQRRLAPVRPRPPSPPGADLRMRAGGQP
jgi:oligosaccharide repeat unit polymerase